VKVDGITYKKYDGQRPAIDPFTSTTYTFNEKRTLKNVGDHKKIEADFTGNRGPWGLVKNQNIDTPRWYPFIKKVQDDDKRWKVFEQSSIFAQMIRRGFFKQSRLTDSLDMQTGEIQHSNGVGFVGEPLENKFGSKDIFFLRPENRPDEEA
jgi:hypothetical protein